MTFQNLQTMGPQKDIEKMFFLEKDCKQANPFTPQNQV